MFTSACAGQKGGAVAGQPGAWQLSLPAVAQAVPFLYVPGWNFLGATYGFGVVQAFYMGSFRINPGTPSSAGVTPDSGGSFEVIANTIWSPINLSWNLGGGWFWSVTFNFMASGWLALGRYAEPGLLDLRAGDGDLVPRQ